VELLNYSPYTKGAHIPIQKEIKSDYSEPKNYKMDIFNENEALKINHHKRSIDSLYD
jgi:hypothetical protein